MVVPSVPAKVNELLIVKVLPAAILIVALAPPVGVITKVDHEGPAAVAPTKAKLLENLQSQLVNKVKLL